MREAKDVILVSPKLGIGGIQRALTNIANWFVNNGYSVTFISCKREEVFYPLDKKVKILMPIINHPGSGGNILLHYLYVIKFLRKEFKNSQSKNIISFGDAFNPLVLIAGIGLKKQIHISDRTSPDYKFKWYIKLLKKITYPLSATFVAQTSRAADWNKTKFGNKINIKIIPNPARKVNSGSIDRKKIILYVGRFAWEKAPERLIKSFSEIIDKKGFKLRMCGDGPMLSEMKQLAKNLNVFNEIEFLGRVNDVDFHLSEASIFVLPSILEGFPNALCEAMSAGLPSICFNTIPFEDLGLANKDFLIADDLVKNSLTKNIELLINSQELRKEIGKSAMQIKERLNDKVICKKFAELLIL